MYRLPMWDMYYFTVYVNKLISDYIDYLTTSDEADDEIEMRPVCSPK